LWAAWEVVLTAAWDAQGIYLFWVLENGADVNIVQYCTTVWPFKETIQIKFVRFQIHFNMTTRCYIPDEIPLHSHRYCRSSYTSCHNIISGPVLLRMSCSIHHMVHVLHIVIYLFGPLKERLETKHFWCDDAPLCANTEPWFLLYRN
jgi:hypothetical protein